MTDSIPDFSFIRDDLSRSSIEDAYAAISATDGGWKFLQEFSPDADKGFMFSDHPVLRQIGAHMSVGHSGLSYAWTMRQMEYIAKNGFSAYKAKWA